MVLLRLLSFRSPYSLAWSILALSAIVAWAGVTRPDIDVIQLMVRWGRRENELPAISIGASVLQFLLSIATIPAAKLLPPSVLDQPEDLERTRPPCW